MTTTALMTAVAVLFGAVTAHTAHAVEKLCTGGPGPQRQHAKRARVRQKTISSSPPESA